VAVLPRLGRSHLDDLAGLVMEHDNHALPHFTSVDGVRIGSHFVVLSQAMSVKAG